MWELLVESGHYKYLLSGLQITLLVSVFSLFLGYFFGLLLAMIRKYHQDTGKLKIFATLSDIYISIIRGTPSTLQLLIMFHVILANVNNLVAVAIISFGMNSSAYMAEVYRTGIQSVDAKELEAGRALGLTYGQTFFHVLLPQAIKKSLPAIGNETITVFKETSVAGLIGLVDLTRASGIIMSLTYKASIPYLAAGMIYFLGVLLLEKLFQFIEGRVAYVKN